MTFFGRLATTFVATKNDIIYFSFSLLFFSSVVTFSDRRSAQMKELQRAGASRNGVDFCQKSFGGVGCSLAIFSKSRISLEVY